MDNVSPSQNPNPLVAAFIEALKDPESREILKDIFSDALAVVNSPVIGEADEDICLISGAMQLTGLARQSIYQRVHYGTIPHFKRGGKLYFSKSQIREWIKGQNSENSK